MLGINQGDLERVINSAKTVELTDSEASPAHYTGWLVFLLFLNFNVLHELNKDPSAVC